MTPVIELAKVENELRKLEADKRTLIERSMDIRSKHDTARKVLTDLERQTLTVTNAIKNLDNEIFQTQRALGRLRQDVRNEKM